MRPVRITIKNYRCFSDQHPLRFDLTGGTIAFIGPNNSGKSAALKFFYEFRGIWGAIANLAAGGRPHQSDLTFGFIFPFAVDDPERIFNFGNKRDATFEFEFADLASTRHIVRRIHITVSRGNPQLASVTMETNRGLTFKRIQEGGRDGKWGLPEHPGEIIDTFGLEFFRKLEGAFYIGAFRNAINQAANNQDYYDIKVGSDFVRMWDEWKSGMGINSTRNAKKILAITQTIKDMYGFSQLDVNPTTNNAGFTVHVDGEILPLHDLGSGIAQCLIVLSNVAIKSPPLILIDEPELNLHPALQQRFIEQLSEFGQDGIIFATHSLGLARTAADPIYSFRRQGPDTHVHLYEGIPNLVEFCAFRRT